MSLLKFSLGKYGEPIFWELRTLELAIEELIDDHALTTMKNIGGTLHGASEGSW